MKGWKEGIFHQNVATRFATLMSSWVWILSCILMHILPLMWLQCYIVNVTSTLHVLYSYDEFTSTVHGRLQCQGVLVNDREVTHDGKVPVYLLLHLPRRCVPFHWLSLIKDKKIIISPQQPFFIILWALRQKPNHLKPTHLGSNNTQVSIRNRELLGGST